jgi:hypothetical protein
MHAIILQIVALAALQASFPQPALGKVQTVTIANAAVTASS